MGCERMEGMTPEELLAWANGLGICEFGPCKQALKLLEEAAEVFGAWQDWDRGTDFKPKSRIAVLDEIADVVQVACNLAAAFGVTDFAPYMQDCRIRNEERGRYGNTGVE